MPPTDSLNFTQVHVGEDIFEVVPTFWYLDDVIGESDDCVDATSAHASLQHGNILDNYCQSFPIMVFH